MNLLHLISGIYCSIISYENNDKSLYLSKDLEFLSDKDKAVTIYPIKIGNSKSDEVVLSSKHNIVVQVIDGNVEMAQFTDVKNKTADISSFKSVKIDDKEFESIAFRIEKDSAPGKVKIFTKSGNCLIMGDSNNLTIGKGSLCKTQDAYLKLKPDPKESKDNKKEPDESQKKDKKAPIKSPKEKKPDELDKKESTGSPKEKKPGNSKSKKKTKAPKDDENNDYKPSDEKQATESDEILEESKTSEHHIKRWESQAINEIKEKLDYALEFLNKLKANSDKILSEKSSKNETKDPDSADDLSSVSVTDLEEPDDSNSDLNYSESEDKTRNGRKIQKHISTNLEIVDESSHKAPEIKHHKKLKPKRKAKSNKAPRHRSSKLHPKRSKNPKRSKKAPKRKRAEFYDDSTQNSNLTPTYVEPRPISQKSPPILTQLANPILPPANLAQQYYVPQPEPPTGLYQPPATNYQNTPIVYQNPITPYQNTPITYPNTSDSAPNQNMNPDGFGKQIVSELPSIDGSSDSDITRPSVTGESDSAQRNQDALDLIRKVINKVINNKNRNVMRSG